MKKPEKMLVGQKWLYHQSPGDTLFLVISRDLAGIQLKVLRSSSPYYSVGSITGASETAFLTMNAIEFVGDRVLSTRKRPKLFIVSCRGCGKDFPWTVGTSKKNYLCLPCRS